MRSKNTLKRLLPALCLFLAGLSGTAPPGLRPLAYVDPLIDSHKSRWIYFSSACRPFGMLNLSPDTWVQGTWNLNLDQYSIKIGEPQSRSLVGLII